MEMRRGGGVVKRIALSSSIVSKRFRGLHRHTNDYLMVYHRFTGITATARRSDAEKGTWDFRGRKIDVMTCIIVYLVAMAFFRFPTL